MSRKELRDEVAIAAFKAIIEKLPFQKHAKGADHYSRSTND